MSDKVQVSISFREELVGDEAGSDSFYIKVTPKVKIKPIVTADTLARDVMRELQAAVRARSKK